MTAANEPIPLSATCQSCRMWVYAVGDTPKPPEAPTVQGHCHRWPEPIKTGWRHWCGEWRPLVQPAADAKARTVGRAA